MTQILISTDGKNNSGDASWENAEIVIDPYAFVRVQDEGVLVLADTKVLNFQGGNISATVGGPNQVNVTVVGTGGSIVVEDEGVLVEALATLLNFKGSGISATSAGVGQVDVTVTTPAPNIVEVNTTTYNVTTTDEIVLINQTVDAAVNVNLPAGASHVNGLVTIKDKKGTAGTRNITITAAAGETVDGLAARTINIDYAARQLVFYAGEWSII